MIYDLSTFGGVSNLTKFFEVFQNCVGGEFFENGLGFCRGLTIRMRRLTYCLCNSVVLELHKKKITHKKLVSMISKMWNFTLSEPLTS